MDSSFPWSVYLVVLMIVSVFLLVIWIVWVAIKRDETEGAESVRRHRATGRLLPPCSLCGSRRVSSVKELPGNGVEFRCQECGMRTVAGG